jgi:hypothetical protein
MNGYSRYAATSVWVGNADKSLVHDGPQWNYASADTTIHLFKNWMGQYHADLEARGVFKTPANFDSLQPSNVAFKPFQTATTDRSGHGGGCHQYINGWQRTDITYPGDCNGGNYVPLPSFMPQLAVQLALRRGIPIAGYSSYVPPRSNNVSPSSDDNEPPSQAVQPTPTPVIEQNGGGGASQPPAGNQRPTPQRPVPNNGNGNGNRGR